MMAIVRKKEQTECLYGLSESLLKAIKLSKSSLWTFLVLKFSNWPHKKVVEPQNVPFLVLLGQLDLLKGLYGQ